MKGASNLWHATFASTAPDGGISGISRRYRCSSIHGRRVVFKSLTLSPGQHGVGTNIRMGGSLIN
jgi:hypothetical protein